MNLKTLCGKSFGICSNLDSMNKWLKVYFTENRKMPDIISISQTGSLIVVWYWEENV